jgi:hypothetical protein
MIPTTYIPPHTNYLKHPIYKNIKIINSPFGFYRYINPHSKLAWGQYMESSYLVLSFSPLPAELIKTLLSPYRGMLDRDI